MTYYLPKMGQDAVFVRTLNGHNSVIFIRLDVRPHQNDQLIETNRMAVFWTFFALRPHMGNMGRWTQNCTQNVGTQLIGQNNVFLIFRGEPP